MTTIEQQTDTPFSREVDYRLAKWIIRNKEQLLEPDEIEEIWRELLSFYAPPVFRAAAGKTGFRVAAYARYVLSFV